MNRIGYALLALLLLQLGIIGSLYWSERDSARSNLGLSLAETDLYPLDELQLTDGRGSETRLTRHGDSWVLPDLGGLPADRARVENLLTTLTSSDPGWAVAHSLAARQRFQVAHYHFRRKVNLLAHGQPVGTVYLGTSPGFRKVHARNEQRDEIYSVELNLFDVPARGDKWLNRELLEVRAPLRIIADGYSLARDGGEWRLGSGSTPEPRELEALLTALKTLQIDGIASDSVQQQLASQEAELVLEIESLGGSAILSLFLWGEEHFISSSNYPYLFRVSSYTYEKLTGIDALMLSGVN